MLFESHNSGQNPPACNSKSDVTIQHEIINTLWVNDTEVAAYLRDAYGLPVHVSSIDIEVEDLPVGHEYTISWGPEPERSWFKVTDDTGNSDDGQVNFRYFWYNGTVLGALDFFQESTSDDTGTNPTLGKAYAPMLMAQISEDYTAVGSWLATARATSNSIELYKDPQCEEPV